MVKIIQISAVNLSISEYATYIYGLGDDNKVYYWDKKGGEWVLEKNLF